MEMELPECPVCLQTFNSTTTIPRVLPCGHSTCQTCIPQLPQHFPNTIRCPACTQLIPYPTGQPSSALPKNFDLLTFTTQLNPKPEPPKPKPSPSYNFLPSLWSQDLYLTWKHWILPENSLTVGILGKDDIDLSLVSGRRGGETVSLLYVGCLFVNDSLFSFSYIVRVVSFFKELKENVREELGFVLRVFSSRFRLCKVYGLWMNSEDGNVFLVCEKLNGGFVEKLDKMGNGNGGDLVKDVMPRFAMLGMEFCEALASLHDEELASGCLGLSCFNFDRFGCVFVDSSEMLVLGRKVRQCIAEFVALDSENEKAFDVLLRLRAFVSPEVLFKLLQNEGSALNCSSSECSVGYFSDVWSLGCILISILVGDSCTEKLFRTLYNYIPDIRKGNFVEFSGLYKGWMESVSSTLETSLGSEFVLLHQILCRCLEYDTGSRPHVTDVWRCIRELVIRPNVDFLGSVDELSSMENMIHCLIFGSLCDMSNERGREIRRKTDHHLQESGDGADLHQNKNEICEKDIVEGMRLGKFESTDLKGHLDCITGLAVGGGFLFSSSFDKTVQVWSVQDYSHIHSFRGHEHRVMAVVFVDATEPLCISGDSGGGIFVWAIGKSLGHEPLKKWYEQKDWRYSGIHALAVSGVEHIYTGSGDKSIKAWSLEDDSLTCTMNGHKSVVSSLAVCNGVLYSGSWDGTVRLWSINDHSPLTVLGDDTSGNVASVLSLSVDHDMLAVSHENGCLKLWRDNMLSRSIETQCGAIFALDINEKWLFMGGWDETVNVKELLGDELHIDTISVGSIACNAVITALLYWEGKLFVGFADKIIKVYYYRL